MVSTPNGSRLSSIFKAYDVRGTVPDQLDAATLHAIGVGMARFARRAEGAKSCVVGRDMRESGVEFSKAFSAGLISEGMEVLDIGLCSTDMLYFASGHLDRPGAMLTASHNPSNYNGIKFCLARAKPVGQDSGLLDIRLAAEEALPSAPPGGGAGEVAGNPAYAEVDLLADFARHVHSFVDLGVLRPLKIVADTANGMGGLVAPAVFRGLPFELEVLFGELDGTFPNHPADPIQIENQADLRARLLATGADVGLAFDGDADRVFLVDDKAQPVSGSLTTAIVAAAMLDKHPAATILYNLICSKAVPEIVAERGGTPVRTRVGHSFVKAVMAETGAVFGGEHSGHYYFSDNFRADSGIIAAITVLEVMSNTGQSLSELRKPFDRYADSGEINTEVGDPAAVIAGIEERFAASGGSADHLDGLTVDRGDWWFNLRPSNTEPLLRLNVEAASSQECAARVDEVLGQIRELGAAGGPTNRSAQNGT
ncbi:MAG TPA: phosphomannomutase/phosphoglucomutase [Acidimicrobiales bacterium]|nr:phosphomannomutase/phosphoglucomutase [Acidimicrobiales bacterium]